VLYGVCAFFGLLALFFMSDQGAGKLTGLILLVTGAAVVLIAGRLRYHEVDEVRAGLRRNLAERRLRIANHIRVRRASRMLAKAQTLAALITVVGEMLELGEFVYVTVQLGQGGNGEQAGRVLARESGHKVLRNVELRGGLICWEWERGDRAGREITESHLFWTLKLPLSTQQAGWGYITFHREFGGDDLLLDVNYLSNLFRRELALAAERVLTKEWPESMPGSILSLSGEHKLPRPLDVG
jgi:hypothetical protein